MRVRNIAEPIVTLALPVWRAGRYSILNPAGTLSQLAAESESGKILPVSKIDKTTWQVQTHGNSEIHVRYSIYANSLGDRTRHVDDTHAFLSGATVFLYIPERRAESLTYDNQQAWTGNCLSPVGRANRREDRPWPGRPAE